jgi:DNA-binding transcriptional LysR family regulator
VIGSADHRTQEVTAVLFEQLEAFVEVARRASVRSAAGVLHVSQPALSGRIAALEAIVGHSLFERRRNGMVLTAAGRALLPYAERALAAVEAGIGHARDAAQGTTEELVVGAAPAVATYVLPELVARLRHLRPTLRTLVRTGHSEEVAALVADGEADLGLVRELADPRLVAEPLYAEALLLVVRPDHPFAYEGRIEVGRLTESVLILFDRGSSEHASTQGLLRGAGVVPRGTMEVDNVETAKRMTIRGLGVAVLPSTAVADAIAEGTLVAIELRGAALPRRRIVAVRPRAAVDPLPEELVALLRSIPALVPGAEPVDTEARGP